MRHSCAPLTILICSLLWACSDGSDRPALPQFQPIPQPLLELPPDIGQIVLISTEFALNQVEYSATEYFVSGRASAFSNSGELTPDGRWTVFAVDEADFRTRIVVYRPTQAEDFSGTVYVEWLNVTSGFGTAPVWRSTHTEMIRRGHAWIAVDAQRVGIEGNPAAVIPLPFYLKAANPERYASLDHPGDSFSYDIFAQIAQAVRAPGELDPLEGLSSQRIIAAGQSQSASRLTTFYNALQAVYGAFDGYLLLARPVSVYQQLTDGQSSGVLTSGSAPLLQADIPDNMPPARVEIRGDLQTPLMMVQSETDVLSLRSIEQRQMDANNFRLWEIAGAAHADYYGGIAGGQDTGESPEFAVVRESSTIAGIINCSLPINSGPFAWVANAAVRALEQWVRGDSTPASAELLSTLPDDSAFALDSDGNALKGVRTPYVDAPAATLSGLGQPAADAFCRLYGTTKLFDASRMASRYVDKAGYVSAVREEAQKAVAERFLTQEDAQRIVAAAGLQWDDLEHASLQD
jgi:alpha/beta hydrolase family protein